MLEIIKFEILDNYNVLLEFKDGTIKKVDLSYLLDRKIFAPIKDYNIFKKIQLINDSIGWDIDGTVLDISPEKLYDM